MLKVPKRKQNVQTETAEQKTKANIILKNKMLHTTEISKVTKMPKVYENESKILKREAQNEAIRKRK